MTAGLPAHKRWAGATGIQALGRIKVASNKDVAPIPSGNLLAIAYAPASLSIIPNNYHGWYSKFAHHIHTQEYLHWLATVSKAARLRQIKAPQIMTQ